MTDFKELSKEEEQEESVLIDANEKNDGKREAMEVVEAARQKEYRHPSFGGQLFMGTFNSTLLAPFPEQDAADKKDADAFIEDIEDYLKNNLDADAVDTNRKIPQEVIDGLAKRGVFAMKVPKEYNGLGFSQMNYCRAVMKIASHCGSTGTLVSAHQSIGVPQPLKMYGTEEQKKKFFPRFREGSISAFALTEVDVGSDPARMATTATLSEDGSQYIINGEKLWCTNGTVADIIVVMAQTKPKMVRGKEKKQISAFIVEMNTPGIDILHRCSFMGLNGIENGLIRFKDVKIPKDNLLWAEGRGLALALGTINIGRLTLPAACAGASKLCLKAIRQWGNERVQWGLPIGLHEASREKVSHIAATTLAMDAMTWITSYWADEGKVDIRIEAAMAKMFCTEALWDITDKTMQLRGGRGYERSQSMTARGEKNAYPIERMMRDCRVNTILEGSTEIMKLFLAREAMDPHLRMAKDILDPKTSIFKKITTAFKLTGFYIPWCLKQTFGGLFTKSHSDLGPLAKEFKYVEKTAHKLARKLFFNMARYQQKLERKQMTLGRLMEIGTELFAISATCSYAVMLHKKTPSDNTQIDLAKYFCQIARRRIEKNFDDLGNNVDRECNAVAKTVMEGEFKWLEEGITNNFPDE